MDTVKVKLDQGQVNLLEHAMNVMSMDNDEIVKCYCNAGFGEIFMDVFDLDTLIKALYIGYEAEQTPEEKVLEYYIHTREDYQTALVGDKDTHWFEMRGIKTTLTLLGIEIEGINK